MKRYTYCIFAEIHNKQPVETGELFSDLSYNEIYDILLDKAEQKYGHDSVPTLHPDLLSRISYQNSKSKSNYPLFAS